MNNLSARSSRSISQWSCVRQIPVAHQVCIILSKLHNGRQLKEQMHGKQSGRLVFPWSRHVFLELGRHSCTALLSLMRASVVFQPWQSCRSACNCFESQDLIINILFQTNWQSISFSPCFHAVLGEIPGKRLNKWSVLVPVLEDRRHPSLSRYCRPGVLCMDSLMIVVTDFLSQIPHFFENQHWLSYK